MAKRHRAAPATEARGELGRMIARGKADARKLAPARILLQAGEAEGGPARGVSVRTVERGLRAALPPEGEARWSWRPPAARTVERGTAARSRTRRGVERPKEPDQAPRTPPDTRCLKE